MRGLTSAIVTMVAGLGFRSVSSASLRANGEGSTVFRSTTLPSALDTIFWARHKPAQVKRLRFHCPFWPVWIRPCVNRRC